MTTHTTTLDAREEIAEGRMAFHLRKPEGFEGSSWTNVGENGHKTAAKPYWERVSGV